MIRSCLPHLRPMGIGVKPVIPAHDLALIRNVRGHPGDKIQIDLEYFNQVRSNVLPPRRL